MVKEPPDSNSHKGPQGHDQGHDQQEPILVDTNPYMDLDDLERPRESEPGSMEKSDSTPKGSTRSRSSLRLNPSSLEKRQSLTQHSLKTGKMHNLYQRDDESIMDNSHDNDLDIKTVMSGLDNAIDGGKESALEDDGDSTTETRSTWDTLISEPDSGTSGGHESSSPDRDMTYEIMPTNDVITREFEEYVEVNSPYTEENEAKIRQSSIEEKWKLVFNWEKQNEPLCPASMYLDNLRKHTGTTRQRSQSFRKSTSETTSRLSYWLRKLKLDLKVSPNGFVSEFVGKPHDGLTVLVDVLKSIQEEQNKLQSIRKSKLEHLNNALLDEYDCLLCIKFALKSPDNVPSLLKTRDAVETIAMCLLSTFRKSTVTVLEILTLVSEKPAGFLMVTDALTSFRLKSMESVRFKLLVSMLHSQTNKHFQAVCVRFFNKLLSCTDNANEKVYLQGELEKAGFEPDALDRYSLGQSADFDELQKELDIWRKNYINVENSRQELLALQNRNTMLREEIDRQQASLKEIAEDKVKLTKAKADANAHCDKLREKAAEMQDLLGRVMRLYKEQVGVDATEEIEGLEDYARPLDTYATVRDKYSTVSSSNSRVLPSMDGPPGTPAPPAPPPTPPSYLSQTIRRKVVKHDNLPIFPWSPIHSVKDTMFADIDDEAKLREINFEDFNKKFRLPSKEIEAKERGEKIIRKHSNLITFVQQARARNLIITMRQTSLTWKNIGQAINSCDLKQLPGECAELLLKYQPTKDEIKKLAEHSKEYSSLGEAEKYLFQLSQIERLERKLSLIAFMGKFQEVVESVKPDIEVIRRASESLLRSIKLKKIFELILAFGNYMNSTKKGYAQGFRLESLSKLSEVKSRQNPEITLLHYLVEYIGKKYPELCDFWKELDLCVGKGVSYQSVATDVLGLRKGIDLLRFEREKQSHNSTLDTFYSTASGQVTVVADIFRKMEEVYKHVCAYFGEHYHEMEPDQLVKHVGDFVAAFKKASVDNYKRKHPETPVTYLTHQKSLKQTDAQTQVPTPRGKTVAPEQANLNTPSKNKPSLSKLVNGEVDYPLRNGDITPPVPPKGALYDKTLPESEQLDYNQAKTNGYGGDKSRNQVKETDEEGHVTMIKVTEEKDLLKHGKGVYSELPSDHVTMIKVTEDKDMLKHGKGVYSELPSMNRGDLPKQPRSRSGSSFSEKGDIILRDSNSFFFGAKDPNRDKVKKTPSLNQSGPGAQTNLRRTTTEPARKQPMVVRRYNPSSIDKHHVNDDRSQTRRVFDSRERASEKKHTIYETIPDVLGQSGQEKDNLSNSWSRTDSDTTSEPSELSSASPLSAHSSVGLQRERKTSESSSASRMDDMFAEARNSKVENLTKRKDSKEYTLAEADAINTLNQVLDDNFVVGPVADEDLSTAL